ncbi:MAG: hypothetical protein DRI86_06320 [Bacteroidetes bacterium]|nr:MAG: hypothetical protein DRI86_06320 [Bacteroidota bacterium]
MKAQVYIIILLLLSVNLFSQKLSWDNKENSEVISEIGVNGFTIDLSINNINYQFIKTVDDDYYRLSIDGFGRSLDYGNPELPILKKLIELPEGAQYEIIVENKIVKNINLKDYQIDNYLYPSQLPALKIETKIDNFKINNHLYKTNEFYGNQLVKIERLGTMRSSSLARLEISPIQYNPVLNTIQVVESIRIRININGFDAERLNINKQRYLSPYSQASESQIINSSAYSGSQSKDVSCKIPLKYVIVADTIFRESLQPFIKWKEKKGFKVIEAYLQDTTVGNTTVSIKNYLQTMYTNATVNNPAPIYVLFVGDVAQMPSWSGQIGSHVTDLYYCEFTGDEFPEMMYGRFSANDTSELNPQIEKTIQYEKYEMPDHSFLANSILVAGKDASHSPTWLDGQLNYGTATYFNNSNSTNCMSYLYANGSYLKDLEIRQQVDTGAYIVNYTGHGSPLGWADPVFNVNNVPNMQNKDRYPLMIANACITNKFNSSVCFGEALLRARDKGAIGYIGASDNTYWDEDYYWAVGYGSVSANPTYSTTGPGLYDLMYHNHNESFSDWAMSSSQYIKVGNLAVTQGGSSSRYYWEVYHVMGDPSLMAYMKIPDPITASFIPFIQAGWSSYSINTVPFAQVALSKGDTLISSVIADTNGVATLYLDSFTYQGVLDIVITAQNHAPYFSNVFGGAASGPYVVVSDVIIDDSLLNNNGQSEYSELINMDVDFSNLTTFDAINTQAVLRINDSEVKIVDSIVSIGSVLANDTLLKDDAFKIQIDSTATDNHMVSCEIVITDNAGGQWISPYYFTIHAPNIKIHQYVIDDSVGGNNNGIVEAGESVVVKVLLENIGSRDALVVNSAYITTDNRATVSGNSLIDTLSSGESKWAEFNVSFDASLQNGQYINFAFNYTCEAYSASKLMPILIGEVDEDFETADFSKFIWETDSSSLYWIIDSTYKYEGNYSMRSAMNMQNDDTSSISITMRVLADGDISFYRKVSTEQGYDPLYFFIDGSEKGKWSGNRNWELFSFPVTAGIHTFKWSYIKDYYQASYLDATWIDNIKFPPTDVWSNIENESEESISSIKIFPNPAIDRVNIEFEVKTRANVATTVFNQLGKIVIAENNHGKFDLGINHMKINTKSLRSGVYFIRIRVGEQEFFQKLIIQ